jgi:hypothetical protein
MDEFFSELHCLYRANKFCDVTLICGESVNDKEDELTAANSISCHKIVLASFSPYFQAMFSSNLIETKTNRVHLPNFDLDALREVIAYAYSGSISFNVHNVQNILAIAFMFNLKQVVNAASDFMESKLDASNAVEAYALARHHMCEYLANKSREFINRCFVDVAKTSEFIECENVELLVELLSSDDLDVASEEFVLTTVLKWIEHNYETRLEHLERLFFSCVRLSLIESGTINEIFMKYQSIITPNEKCLQAIRDCITGDYQPPSVPKNSANENTHTVLIKKEVKRSGMLKADRCFLLIGGNCDNDEGCYVNCFNPFNGEKYFLSKSFLDKSKFLTKGFFHIENPG